MHIKNETPISRRMIERQAPNLGQIIEAAYRAHETMLRALELCQTYPVGETRNTYEADLMRQVTRLNQTSHRIGRTIHSAWIVNQFNEVKTEIDRTVHYYEQRRRV